VSLTFWLPLVWLTWVVPKIHPEFLTDYEIAKGTTLYVCIGFFLSTFIQFGIGCMFYQGAYTSVKNQSANMDVLVTLGTTAAWTYGVLLMLMGCDDSESHYKQVKMHTRCFEMSATLITVICFGKLLEAYSKKKTVDKLS
jgi:P-type Cu+ transporter